MKAWMSKNFGKFATELLPLIDFRIEFLAHLSRRLKGELIVYPCSVVVVVVVVVIVVVHHFQT